MIFQKKESGKDTTEREARKNMERQSITPKPHRNPEIGLTSPYDDPLANTGSQVGNYMTKDLPSQKKIKDVDENASTNKDETNNAKGLVTLKIMAASFGEIVSILMRSEQHQHYSLRDLEWLVLPALHSGQYSIAEAQSVEKNAAAPVGVVLWALVSPEVDKRLSTELNSPIRLRPDEWTSGDIPWLIYAGGAPTVIEQMLAQLVKTQWKGSPPKLRQRAQNGQVVVTQLGDEETASQKELGV